jgi:hypothetical protein
MCARGGEGGQPPGIEERKEKGGEVRKEKEEWKREEGKDKKKGGKM